ncbi:MAG: helix-turn-helix transcriptional regulator [Colwellia sp.]|nr:helix-turn-helix transcriptional regulator [Colwellia sp.]
MHKLLNKHLNILYQAALDPSLWDIFLAELIQDVDAKSALITVDHPEEGQAILMSSVGFDSAAMDEYTEYYFGKDVWVDALLTTATNQFLHSEEVMSLSEFKKTEIFNDYSKSQDIYHATGAYVATQDGLDIRIAMQRGRSQGAYDRETMQYLNLLRPHITRALQLSKKLNVQHLITKALESTLNSDARCMLIIDESTKLLYNNEAADNLLEADSVFHLNSKKLTFNNASNQRTFEKILFELKNFPINNPVTTSTFDVRMKKNDEHYEFFVSPIDVATSIVRAFVSGTNYLIIGRKISTQPSIEVYLMNAFRLTPKEIEVAIAISQGRSIANISDSRHRSIHTIRTQLKNVLRKLNLKSQNQLTTFINRLDQKIS